MSHATNNLQPNVTGVTYTKAVFAGSVTALLLVVSMAYVMSVTASVTERDSVTGVTGNFYVLTARPIWWHDVVATMAHTQRLPLMFVDSESETVRKAQPIDCAAVTGEHRASSVRLGVGLPYMR